MLPWPLEVEISTRQSSICCTSVVKSMLRGWGCIKIFQIASYFRYQVDPLVLTKYHTFIFNYFHLKTYDTQQKYSNKRGNCTFCNCKMTLCQVSLMIKLLIPGLYEFNEKQLPLNFQESFT